VVPPRPVPAVKNLAVYANRRVQGPLRQTSSISLVIAGNPQCAARLELDVSRQLRGKLTPQPLRINSEGPAASASRPSPQCGPSRRGSAAAMPRASTTIVRSPRPHTPARRLRPRCQRPQSLTSEMDMTLAIIPIVYNRGYYFWRLQCKRPDLPESARRGNSGSH